ncbi:hypothetical protein BH24ACI3_BH24ACI3_11220 [soil metagenome]
MKQTVYLRAMKFAQLSVMALVFCVTQALSQTAVELADIWEKEHVSDKLPSNVRHRDLLKYLDGLRALGIKVDEVGRSNANREIFQVQWGRGPLRVFLWSQMHGDEPTATPALIDMFTVLQKNRDKDWVKKIEETMTIRAVPMLNPDGAELYIRRNLQGIDINRDAADLKTPEGRLLKQLRDAWQPEIGFNLHNQNALTAAGLTDRQAAISFLVVYGDEAKTTSDGHERNKRLVAAMTQAIEQFIPGYVGRYGDEWTPNAFGDNFSAWGTPTILIETGGLHSKDEMYLVKMNFVAFLTALKSIADGTEKNFSPINYEMIPQNAGGRLVDVVFRNATVIDRTKPTEPTVADIGLVKERRRAEFNSPTSVRRLGENISARGLDEYDATGFAVVGRFQVIRQGSPGELLFYRIDRNVEWTAANLETDFPPDAIFSLGRWHKGENLLKKK